MAKLTKALVRRHAGRSDAYGAALLDIAQDHLLSLIAGAGFFDTGDLVFKGGTSLRKCRLGPAGRFSTDLDFVAPNEDVVLDVCEAINDSSVGGSTSTWKLTEATDDTGGSLSSTTNSGAQILRRPSSSPVVHCCANRNTLRSYPAPSTKRKKSRCR